MRSIRKILVPVDFSDGSDEAVHQALDLARPLGAEVTLMHAYQIPAYTLPDGSGLVAWPETAARIVSHVEEQLHALRGRVSEPGGVPVSTLTGEGETVQEVVRAAREGDFNLIVMGTHGRTGIRRALLGSVAEQVVRHAECPVLTVRRHDAQKLTALPYPVLV